MPSNLNATFFDALRVYQFWEEFSTNYQRRAFTPWRNVKAKTDPETAAAVWLSIAIFKWSLYFACCK